MAYDNNRTPSIGSATPIVDIYVTSNLAFQAMALGKESMAGHWCMQCTSSKAQVLDDGTMWTMEAMVRLGKEAKRKKGEPQLGIKQQPWWPFIPIRSAKRDDNYGASNIVLPCPGS